METLKRYFLKECEATFLDVRKKVMKKIMKGKMIITFVKIILSKKNMVFL